jgi:PAS domain S-box-containing protein
MDSIVDDYDQNYHQKIKQLRKIEFLLSIVLLIVLSLEMFLVFIPLIKMLANTIQKLKVSEKSAKDLATKLNQANVKLKQRNKEYNDTSLAIDKSVHLIRTDEEGRIIYANEQYCKLTKYSLIELINKPLFYNNSGGSESIIYDHIRSQDKKRKVWRNEVHDTASDGTEFWLDVTLFPIINDLGDLYEYLVICSDITKRKKAEKELEVINETRFLRQEEDQKIRSKSIIQGQEEERKRMAIEVHDGLGQMLTALKFNCEALNDKIPENQLVVSNMKSLLHQIIIETRRISSNLLPTVFEDFGLVPALKEMIRSVEAFSNAKIKLFFGDTPLKRLSNEIEIAIYRVAQEAINNALKHSDATEIEISYTQDAEFVYLGVRDNGKGIENEKDLDKRRGNGLRNMRERARLVEGRLTIDSNFETGTRIVLEIPIE